MPACIIIFVTYIISQFRGLGFVYLISIFVTWIIGIKLRLHVVERYSIHTHGNTLECLIAAFCCPCSLSQSEWVDTWVHAWLAIVTDIS
jgi:hypothetical protein